MATNYDFPYNKYLHKMGGGEGYAYEYGFRFRGGEGEGITFKTGFNWEGGVRWD